MSDKINVLVSLHRGYGLGDAVQMSAVLRHAKKYRTHWNMDFQAEEGRYCIGNGIADHTFSFNEPYPVSHYDAEVLICLYPTWHNYHNKPNTRVTSCLNEIFGLEWDRECGRYQVNVCEDAKSSAGIFLHNIKPKDRLDKKFVAIHYQGETLQQKKNLGNDQALTICETIQNLERIPLLLDWQDKSPLHYSYKIPTVGQFSFSKQWGRDAQMNCAIIRQCEAFIGIDSGPSKCASATNVPSLVVWTGHHPAEFHDPAPNTTHLVPSGFHNLKPVCDDPGVTKWFNSNYHVMYYKDEFCLTDCVKNWLKRILK